MQLINIHIIEATLVLQTGLHIGGGDSEIHIGGIDNEVIKHPVSGEPYIPGSSLKGKIRSLLEWKSGAVQEAPLGKKEYDNAQSEQQAAAIKQILQRLTESGFIELAEGTMYPVLTGAPRMLPTILLWVNWFLVGP